MIQVQNLTKSYDGRRVLDAVSFTAKDGCITGFVGPNGAGKSTTMRIVACLEKPDSGSALVNKVPYRETPNPIRAMGVYLGQGYLPLHMTGKAYLSYVCKVAGMPKTRVDELLDMVELTGAARKKIASYSLGMKQRAGIAAALAGDPAALMLDEPVNGLDPMGVQWLRGVLREQASAGKAVLLSSHLLTELELVADRVVMLDHGRVVARGDMTDLGNAGESRVMVSTSDNHMLYILLDKEGVDVEEEGPALSVSGMTAREVGLIAYQNGLMVDYLEEKHSSLEEVFMATAARYQDGGAGDE